jgi:hypothetical protein
MRRGRWNDRGTSGGTRLAFSRRMTSISQYSCLTPLGLDEQPSGFEAISFQKGNNIVISFAGTGTAVDWWANAGGFFGLNSEQLTQAAEHYLQFDMSSNSFERSAA